MTINICSGKHTAWIRQSKSALALGTMICLSTSFVHAACEDINSLKTAAQSNFSGPLEVDISSEDTLPLTDAKSCNIAVTSGSKRVFACIWEYRLKDPLATAKYEAVNNRVASCLGEDAKITNDQPVNHPDFYAQIQYQRDKSGFFVSLKDKSSLEKTFVFLRVSQNTSK